MKIANKKSYFYVVVCSAFLLILGIQCKDSVTNPPPFSGPLELLYPKGGSGQSFKVGQPVLIKWSIHDRSAITSVEIDYSLDGGKTYNANSLATNSFPYPDTTYNWTPTVDQVSNKFILKVKNYEPPYQHDVSASFVVTQ